ncbi:MAG: NUDIX domain-containing protein [Proteobacteria bacterium]|nr:NUDIX domain-containing protein [Pseudomonadota bacterium]
MTADAVVYLSQKAFVRRGDELLILNQPRWGLDFPGGKLQVGEGDLTAALRREVAEETGLDIEVGPAFITWLDDVHPLYVKTGTPVLLVGHRCRWTAGEVRLSEEHDGWRWIGPGLFHEVDDGSTYAAALQACFAREWD